MTIKLKTIKDLSNESRYDSKEDIKLNAILVQDLKQEAIKDIKFLRKHHNKEYRECCPKEIEKYFEYSCMACSEGCGMCGVEILEKYIMWKNSITEEDLMTNEQINNRENGEIGNN